LNTLLMVATGILIALFFVLFRKRPTWALPLLIATLPFERIGSFDIILGANDLTVRVSQIIAVAMIASTLIWWKPAQPQGLDRFLVAYLGAGALSIFAAPATLRSVLVLLFTVFGAAVYWSVRRQIRDLGSLDRIATALWWIVIFTSLAALYQFFGDLLGLSNAWTGLSDRYTKIVFGFPRVQAFSLEPLYLVNLLLLPLGVFLALALRGPSLRNLLSLFLLSLITTLSLSRGGYAASVVIVLLVLAFSYRSSSRKNVVLALAPLVVGIAAALALVTGSGAISSLAGEAQKKGSTQGIAAFSSHAANVETTFTISDTASGDDRTLHRELAWEAFKQHPITGIGLGNFGQWAAQHHPETGLGPHAIVNNEPLEVLAETGLLGSIPLAAFIALIFRRSYQAWRRSKAGALEKAWLVGLTASLLGALVQYQTFSTLYITHLWVLLGLLVGVQDRLLRDRRPLRRKRSEATS
jgi:O-antigen ligase